MLDAAVDATLVCRFNDLDDIASTLAAHADEIAAVILEPIAHDPPGSIPA
jgi:glutamate-1-semialdehyde aminotransferase